MKYLRKQQYARIELEHERAQNTPTAAKMFEIQMAKEMSETFINDFNLNTLNLNSSSMIFSVCNNGIQWIVDLFC